MLFDAGSIAKNVEAALVVKMTEARLINLDDPLSKFLPVYRNVDRDITVRQLLNHTSGVFNVFEHPEFPWVGPGVDYSELLGMRAIGHGGSSLGYSAAALYLPDYDTSLAWLFNTNESPRKLAEAIMGNTWSFLSEVLRTHMSQAL